MPRRVFPLRSLSAALVLSTSLTAPVLAVDQTITGTQTGPITVNAPIGTLSSSATITASTGNGALILGGNPSRFTQVINTGAITATGATTDGIHAGAGIESFLNSGSIVSDDLGIYYGGLFSGSVMTNTQGGLIQGENAAVEIYYGLNTFVNAGTLQSADGNGFRVSSTAPSGYGYVGTFTNTGTIYSEDAAVSLTGGVGTFNNSGLIETTSNQAGVYATSATYFTNNVGGTIRSTSGSAVEFESSSSPVTVSTFVNNGTLQGGAKGVTFNSVNVGTFTNGATGRIYGGGDAVAFNGNVSVFDNSGWIEATGSGDGVSVIGTAGTFTNQTGGTIKSATGKAIDFDGAVTTFINNGTVESGYKGVDLDSPTGTFINTGTIKSGTGWAVDAASNSITTFSNSGSITSSGSGGVLAGGATSFTNAKTGIIEAEIGGVSFGGAVGSFTNRGTIVSEYAAGAYFGDDVGNFTNSGRINIASEGSGVRIVGDVTGSFVNEYGGQISGAGPVDPAVFIGGSLPSFINSGSIGSDGGVAIQNRPIDSNNDPTTTIGRFINTDTGYIWTSGGNAINANGFGSFSNAGRIEAVGGRGVEAFAMRTESFFNSGSITATDLAVDIGPVGTFTNSATGVIESSGDDAVWFTQSVDSFVNRGRIAATGGSQAGIDLNEAGSFLNAGTISSVGQWGLIVVNTGNGPFINDVGGTISGANFGAYFHRGATAFENRGTITGNVGIGLASYSVKASRIINSGTIQGTGGTAIDFSDGTTNNALDDILELRAGSRILGSVDFAEGSDTLDISGFRSNAVLTVASLENLTTGSALVNDQRDATGTGTVSIIDATAITSAGPSVMGEVAGAISGEIAGALGGQAGGFAPTEPMGYAPSRPVGAAEAAADELVATADPTGPEIWGKMFGGIANKSDEYNAVLGGIIAGSHTAVDANTRLGGVVSVSGSRFATVGGGQTVTGTIGAAGLYGSTDLGSVVVSYSVLGGVAANHSDRTVTAAVTETARADFGSWFWSPELGLSMPVPLFEGVETDAGFKLRYVGGGVGSYTETGSSQNLSVGTAAVNLLDARVELTSKTQVASNDFGDVMLYGTAGLLAQQNFGGSVAIAGFPIAQTPASFAYGAYADITLEGPIGPTAKASASTGLELRSDGLSSASANVGLSSTF